MDTRWITLKQQAVSFFIFRAMCPNDLSNLSPSFFTAALMVGMDLEGGRFFFNAVREGDSILFASDDENECSLWVMALYRATGQSHKPTPPLTSGQNSSISKIQGDADKARKHGMEDYISADPCLFEHAHLFKLLQNLALDYRLNDPFASMVRIQPWKQNTC